MKGRKPVPTALKILRGNPGKRPIEDREPVLEAATNVVPAGLRGRAKKEWKRLADELISTGVLTIGDLHAFEQYCRLVGEVDEYEKLIRRHGVEEAHDLGYPNYLHKLRTLLRQQATEMGLTPSSRTRVKAVKVAKDSSAAAKRDRFFGKGTPPSA